jgi:hypothetical protein
MKIVFAILALSISSCINHHQEAFTLGHTSFTLPPGWSEIRSSSERRVFGSSDGRQQLTISLMRFGAAVTFEDFGLLCQKRIESERRELADGFIQPDTPNPFENSDGFGMFYSGEDRKSGRLFSGYLSYKDSELVAVYLEGLGVAPKDHLESFKTIVSGLGRN